MFSIGCVLDMGLSRDRDRTVSIASKSSQKGLEGQSGGAGTRCEAGKLDDAPGEAGLAGGVCGQ